MYILVYFIIFRDCDYDIYIYKYSPKTRVNRNPNS